MHSFMKIYEELHRSNFKQKCLSIFKQRHLIKMEQKLNLKISIWRLLQLRKNISK